jgi:MscS family membrane protein
MRFGSTTFYARALNENLGGQRQRTLSVRFGAFAIILYAFLIPATVTPSWGQNATSTEPAPVNTKATATADPLGRQSPHSAAMGFIKYIHRKDYRTAARYLQPIPGEDVNLEERAKQLGALYQRFEGDIALLSDDPQGTVENGLPPGEVRAGVLVIGRTTVDIVLVRVDDPTAGKIWLLSHETVAIVPKLQVENERLEVESAILPAALTHRYFLDLSLAQWIGWLLSIPLSFFLASIFELLMHLPLWVRAKVKSIPFTSVWSIRLGKSFRYIMAILLNAVFVYLLRPPIFYRVYYFRILQALLVVCLAWFVSGLMDIGFRHALKQTHAYGKGAESIFVLSQRFVHVALWIVGLIVALSLVGFDMKTALAGLGIGGLAIALGAQKTLENLMGGVSLLADKAVEVGDFCRIGDRLGTVEDIGLRSLKLRTLDQNLLVVPNGLLAQMQFENMAARRKLLINQTFSLRIETEVEALKFVLDGVQNMLDQDPAIENGTSRVRVANFAGAAFELELFAYGKTGDWTQFTAIRQRVILKIAEIVQAAGTRLAAPTRLTYLSKDAPADTKKSIYQPKAGAPAG